MNEIRKYRKKPVVIEAYQTDKVMYIETLEGIHKANVGDYIITGVHGEQYPCKPDIFKKTYELVEEWFDTILYQFVFALFNISSQSITSCL